jgi:hypothetical protein
MGARNVTHAKIAKVASAATRRKAVPPVAVVQRVPMQRGATPKAPGLYVVHYTWAGTGGPYRCRTLLSWSKQARAWCPPGTNTAYTWANTDIEIVGYTGPLEE